MITQLMSAPHISWHWTLLSWITQLLYQTTITPVFYTKAEYLLKFYMYMDVQYLGRPTDLLYSKCMYNIINRLLGACNECWCLHHKWVRVHIVLLIIDIEGLGLSIIVYRGKVLGVSWWFPQSHQTSQFSPSTQIHYTRIPVYS